MPDPKLSRQFREQVVNRDGVFTRGDALSFGITDKALANGIAHGLWSIYESRGIYLLKGSPTTRRSLLRAHLLRAGPRAMATASSALVLYGLDLETSHGERWYAGDGFTYLQVPRNRHLSIEGAVILRDRNQPYVTWWNDLPLAPRKRAIVDALRVLNATDARAVLYRCLQRRWIDLEELTNASVVLHGHRGMKQLKEMALEAARGSHAESERVLDRLLRAGGFRNWRANMKVIDGDQNIATVDIGFESERLAIEVDGRAWHTDPARFQRDRERQNRLVNAGWTVLRFTWEDLVERADDVSRTIATALDNAAGCGTVQIG